MGQSQSAEKDKAFAPRSGNPNDKEKRRRSLHPASSVRGRATPSQPSANTTTATAQTTSPQPLDTPHLEQILHSSAEKSSVGRSSSKRENKDGDQSKHRSVAVPAGPMNVPSPPVSRSRTDELEDKAAEKYDSDELDDPDRERYVRPADHRPPRLPLPIADADIGPVPDSPHLGPADKGNSDFEIFTNDDVLAGDIELKKKSSMLSTATHEDDEIGEELPPVDPKAQTVPTTIEWNYSGHRIYITGTFANWEKKYRMFRRKDGPGFTTTINLPPGTHHLMFLVDDKMITNPGMPTAVDFNNILVNYIEIATEDLGKPRRESKPGDEKRDSIQVHPPQVLPEEDQSDHESVDGEPVAEEILPGDFRQILPAALVDMDLPEDEPRYQQASRIISDNVAPPTLPMFLNKSLLNGNTPVKDDSSVLTLPNHTVLNHLMTSSVKNGVLATSVTTRYKSKYVTTISFKPVPKSPVAVA